MATSVASFADLHRDARVRKGWTQYDAAKALDVHPSTVAQWEQGKKEPNSKQLRTLVRVYGRPILAYLYVPSTTAKGRSLVRPFLSRLLLRFATPRPVAA